MTYVIAIGKISERSAFIDLRTYSALYIVETRSQ